MDYLSQICDKEFIENKSEYKIYLATLRKEDYKSIYKKYVINNINLNEVDKILKDYVSTHNKKFIIYFIYCEFKIQFDNTTRDLKTDYVHNRESDKISQCLLYCIEYLDSKGYKFQNFNQIIINTVSDRCNINMNIIYIPQCSFRNKIKHNYCSKSTNFRLEYKSPLNEETYSYIVYYIRIIAKESI